MDCSFLAYVNLLLSASNYVQEWSLKWIKCHLWLPSWPFLLVDCFCFCNTKDVREVLFPLPLYHLYSRAILKWIASAAVFSVDKVICNLLLVLLVGSSFMFCGNLLLASDGRKFSSENTSRSNGCPVALLSSY